MGDWEVKCLKCGKVVEIKDLLEENKPCVCGNTCFKVVRIPGGKDVKEKEA